MTDADLANVKILEFKPNARYAVVLDKTEMILFMTLDETVRFVHKLGIEPHMIDSHVFKINLSHTTDNERSYIDGYVTAMKENNANTKRP
jgi:hydroxylamine reductase (hybrid-cluster protein)